MPRGCHYLIAAGFCCLFALAGPARAGEDPFKAANQPSVKQATVFAKGEGGYHTYRIPAVLRAANGDVLAFCEGRRKSRSDSGDIDLLMKRSTDGGRSWGTTQVVWNDGPNTCGNPCPVVDRSDGSILLLATHNFGDDDEAEIKLKTGRGTRSVWLLESKNHGGNWSKPREITEQAKSPDWDWYATGPGVGIQIARGEHAGRIVIPCDHSYHDPNGTRQDVDSEYGAHVIYSDDHGQSWSYGEAIIPEMNECQVVELDEPAGRLLINMRSYRGNHCRARSISDDGGKSWTRPIDVPELVEPRCQASLIRAEPPAGDGGGLLIFSNPASQSRVSMTVKISRDAGERWSDGLLIWKGPAAYSCLVPISEGAVGCLYERGEQNAYEEIAFARIPLDALRQTSED